MITRKTLVRKVVAKGSIRAADEAWRDRRAAERDGRPVDAPRAKHSPSSRSAISSACRSSKAGKLVGVLSRSAVRRRLAEDDPPPESGRQRLGGCERRLACEPAIDAMASLSAVRISSSISWPSASNFSGAGPTETWTSSTRAPMAPRILRRSACARCRTKGAMGSIRTPRRACCETGSCKWGREAQSRAFLSAPGIDELYSGVEMRTASASRIASRNLATAPGAGSTSSSSSYGGISFKPSQSSSSTPRARAPPRLAEARCSASRARRLPEMRQDAHRYSAFTSDEVGLQRDIVGERVAAVGHVVRSS